MQALFFRLTATLFLSAILAALAFAAPTTPEVDAGDFLTLELGDVDCDDDVDSVDALKILQKLNNQDPSQESPCYEIGDLVYIIYSGPDHQSKHGDADCDADLDSTDANKILRYVASLSYSQSSPCPSPEIGELWDFRGTIN